MCHTRSYKRIFHICTLLHIQPIACGVSFHQILQSQVRESYVTVRESYVTAYCMWSVIPSNPPISSSWVICHSSWVIFHSLLHVECHAIKSSNLNLIGLVPTERGKRDVMNWIIDWDLRVEKWLSTCNGLWNMTHELWHTYGQVCMYESYGVAMTSRLLKIIGLFCKRAIWKRWYSAKETCNFKEPTNRSHPIHICHMFSTATRIEWLVHTRLVDIWHVRVTRSYVTHSIVTCSCGPHSYVTRSYVTWLVVHTWHDSFIRDITRFLTPDIGLQNTFIRDI